MRSAYDMVIIGGGHNGLVCACYLAAAGLKVRVLERRSIVGGAAVTEEFHPGFRNSVASYTVSLLNPKVIRDLHLHENGLKIVERPLSNIWPHPDGGYLKLSADMAATQAGFARFSKADAEALPAYYKALETIADLLRDLVLETPPNAGGGWRDILSAARLGNRMRRLSLEEQRLLLDLFTKSAAEFLTRWFSHDAILAAFAFDGVVGFYGSPYTPGTAYVLLHHAFGEVNGKKGVWGHAVGGMGAITQAMAREAKKRGVEVTVDAPVAEVIVKDGRAQGVRLKSGEVIAAQAVAANINPKLLYTTMVAPDHLDADILMRMKGYACGSGTFRMNVALDELPQLACLPTDGVADHHGAGIIIAPTLAYMDRAFRDAQAEGWSAQPIVEMLIPSVLDDSLAPKGKHVASLFCQQFAPQLPDGKSWDDVKEQVADLIIDHVTGYIPNFKASILGRQINSPLDLERTFGLVGGDIFHGRLSLDQMFSARPLLGFADYRGAIRGLYHCGSGAHPGGGVTGAPGHNAAREIIRDKKRRHFGFAR